MFFGIILLLLGGALLLVNFGLLSGAELSRLIVFWPLVLVLLGLSLLFKRVRFGWLVVLLAFLASAVFVYEAAFSAHPFVNLKDTGANVKETAISADLPSNIKSTFLKIDIGAVDFNLEDSTSKLIEGVMRSNFMEPKLSVETVGNKADVVLSAITHRAYWWGTPKNTLDLKLSDKVPFDILIDMGASDLKMDLTNVIVNSLRIKTGASNINLRLSDKVADNTAVEIESGASNIEIAVKKGVGVKIDSQTGLSGKNYEGFTKKDGVFVNSEYEKAAAKKINIVVKAGASSIKVKSY